MKLWMVDTLDTHTPTAPSCFCVPLVKDLPYTDLIKCGKFVIRLHWLKDKNMRRITIFITIALLACAGSAIAELDQTQAERAVETRQAVLHLMGWNMAPLGAMARGRIDFDAALVETNAARLQALTKMMADAFSADTRANEVTTEALDVIWEQPEEFAAKVQAVIEASNRLADVTATGDEGAMREAIGNLGSSCGSCHDDFRLDD
jgi:cytochrome c556